MLILLHHFSFLFFFTVGTIHYHLSEFIYLFAILRQAGPVQLLKLVTMGTCINNNKTRSQHRRLSSLLFARSVRVL